MTLKPKRTLILAFTGLLLSVTSASHAQAKRKSNPPDIIVAHTSGKQIIEPNGNAMILKGTNLGNWLVPEGYMFKLGQVNAPHQIDEMLHQLVGPDSLQAFWTKYLDNYITHDDIRYLKRIGCNHIRLPFNYKLFTDDVYMGQRNAGFKYFDRVLDWCRQENLYVLLDMHCAPGGQTGDNIDDSYGYPWLFFSQAEQDKMSEIWTRIAERYKNDPIVIGYDVINEPLAHYFKEEIPDYNHRLYMLYKRMVADIRKVDKKHSLYLEGSVWAGDFGVFETIPDDNIVYEFHKYWFDVSQKAIQDYIDFSNKHNVPIYIGETGENTDEWISDFTKLLNANSISWAYWPYKKMNNTRGIMNFEQPENYDLIIKFSESDRSSYKSLRENMPDRVKVQQALNQYLENCKYKNCFQNKGYIRGLGLRID